MFVQNFNLRISVYCMLVHLSMLFHLHELMAFLFAEQVQILKLSPVAGERDYFYHMDEREGLADLYDIHNKT